MRIKPYLAIVSATLGAGLCFALASGGCGGGKTKPAAPEPAGKAAAAGSKRLELTNGCGWVARLEERVEVRATLFAAEKEGGRKDTISLPPGTWLVPEGVFLPPEGKGKNNDAR